MMSKYFSPYVKKIKDYFSNKCVGLKFACACFLNDSRFLICAMYSYLILMFNSCQDCFCRIHLIVSQLINAYSLLGFPVPLIDLLNVLI